MEKNRQQLVDEAMQALEANDFVSIKSICEELTVRFPDNDSSVLRLWSAACFQTGEANQAEQLLNQAIELEANASNYFNLALVKQVLHKETEAIEAYLKVIQLAPHLVDAYNNLASIYAGQQQLDLAEHYYQQALTIDPHHLYTLKNLGLLYKQRHNFPQAIIYLEQAVAISDEFLDAWNELGLISEQQNNLDQAQLAFTKANALSALQRVIRKAIKWQQLAAIDEQILQGIKTNQLGIEPFTIINTQGLTRALHKQAAKQFAHYRYNLSSSGFFHNLLSLDPHKKLTIGYISADFCDHAVTRLLVEVLEKHHFNQFNFILYSYSPQQDNSYTQRLAKLPYPIKDINSLSDNQAARLIANDQVDILVDLQGYTGTSRLTINTLRPAPVIINWLGYPGSLGEPRLADYIIGDAIITPPSHADDYSEVLALMPHCYQPNDRKRPIANRPSREEVGLPKDAFILCSFNQFVKLNPETFALWCELLRQHPNTLLWLLDPNNEQAKHNLLAQAKQRAITADRIIFAPRVSAAEHFARLELADLALDTFPYNSHTTASDVLWAGVPFMTQQGELFASRVGASILTAFGLPELITYSEQAYLALANQLISDQHYYQQIKQQTLALRHDCPLFNTEQFCHDLENLYQKIWYRYCTNKADRTPIS